jgi:hypothetical protein
VSHLVAPRDHKVQKARVAHITKGYATGGAVNAGTAPKTDPNKPVAPKVRATAAVEGGLAGRRADRPARKDGGRVGKATTVNVVVNAKPEEPSMAMMPPPAPPMPPPGPPPGPPMPPPGGMGGPPPGLGGAPPPGLPMRKRGGRVKSGPAWDAGIKEGTKVQHSPGKSDLKDLGRGKPITYAKGGRIQPLTPRVADALSRAARNAGSDEETVRIQRVAKDRYGAEQPRATGGKVEQPDTSAAGRAAATSAAQDLAGRARGGKVFSDGRAGKQMGPNLPGGAGGGEARLAKETRAKRK